MIDINELRRMVNAAQFESFANSVINSLLDRIEATEKERYNVAQQLVQSEIGKREISEAHNVAKRRLSALAGENITLQAKIAEMEKQEPAGTLHDDGCFVWRETAPHQSNYAGWKMVLYALPGAKGE